MNRERVQKLEEQRSKIQRDYRDTVLEDQQWKRNQQNQQSSLYQKEVIQRDNYNQIKADEQRKQYLSDMNQNNLNHMEQHKMEKKLQQDQVGMDGVTYHQRVNDLKVYESMVQQDKATQKKSYKEILDDQIRYNENLRRNFGNMTQVEKKMNKDDLLAYKIKDET